MKTISILLLVAAAVMSGSGEPFGNPEEPLSLFKRQINCPPGALCQPATNPPEIVTPEPKMAFDVDDAIFHLDDQEFVHPVAKDPANRRQKRGSKPVPIIACNRKTGVCRRI